MEIENPACVKEMTNMRYDGWPLLDQDTLANWYPGRCTPSGSSIYGSVVTIHEHIFFIFIWNKSRYVFNVKLKKCIRLKLTKYICLKLQKCIYFKLKKNKLASLGYASPKLRLTYRLTYLLTGVKCRATSVAKNQFKLIEKTIPSLPHELVNIIQLVLYSSVLILRLARPWRRSWWWGVHQCDPGLWGW